MQQRFIRTALAVALAHNFTAHAASPTDEAVVIVTATRMPTRANEVLSDITALEREDIERAGHVSLPELLGSIPGVQFTTSGGPGASSSLFIRGTNATHALVLVDGQRLSSATMGTTAIEHIPVEQIERIEVLRGPASSLYGSDALGGVIQIFTRHGEGAPAPALFVGAGRYGTVASSAAYGGEVGDTRFHVQAGRERTSGFGDVKEPKTGMFNTFNPDSDGYDNRNFSAHVAQHFAKETRIGADYFYSSGIKHYDAANCDAFYTVCTTAFDNRLRQTLESAALFADARVNSWWKTELRVGRSKDQMLDRQLDPSTGRVSEPRFNTEQTQVSWQNDFLIAGGKLLAAAEWRDVRVNSTQPLAATGQDTRAVIVGYQKSIGAHSLQASARSDNISGLGRHDTGSLAYGYRFAERWTARAALGTAFHAPTFNDLYWPLDPVNFYQGNPSLKPEKARNRDVGLNYEDAGTSASVTLYYNSVTNLIDYVPGTAATGWIGTEGNLGNATIKGATFQYVRHAGAWDWKAAYDVLSARDDATGRFLQRRAPHSGTLEVRRNFGALDIGAQINATSSRFNNPANTQTLGGYGVVNVDTNYRLDKSWSVQARIGNLFAKDYVLVRSTLSPYNEYSVSGRTLFVGLRYAPK